jgi:aspartokinase/homoserine dehydrogenase 1
MHRFYLKPMLAPALPIIGTLNDLLRSGDRVRKIEAVLSGTLNFVFNNYDGEQSFAQVVHQAQTEGYTEPDPRLDLSGTDVMRKIMILAREAGEKLEMDDITNHPLCRPRACRATFTAFYEEMESRKHISTNCTKPRLQRKEVEVCGKIRRRQSFGGLAAY